MTIANLVFLSSLICSFLLFNLLYSVFNERRLSRLPVKSSPSGCQAQAFACTFPDLRERQLAAATAAKRHVANSKPVVLSSLVGLDGLEPSTSRLSGARSNHLSYRPLFRWPLVRSIASLSLKTARVLPENGGDDGNRTHDPLLAGQVLSQLSYTPIRAFEVTVLKN